ncbi:MAG: glycosyltransferase family 2 protein [Acidobacteria bacterium]|nr:glycosyltransferase family 2 protein [Acidobacteriota bacterium]
MIRPDVGVVIVNYNRKSSTLRCIESVLASGYAAVKPVVVENSDQSGERLTSADLRGELVEPPRNIGYAAGCNAGVKRLLESDCDCYLLLNNDAIVTPGCIGTLVARLARDPSIGILSPLIVRPDGRIESAGISISRFTGRHRLVAFGAQPGPGVVSSSRSPQAVTGTAMMVTKSCFEKIGGFDESFFCYFEDVDLCARARAGGLGIAVESAAAVVHNKAAVSADEIYYSCRNHIVVLRRYSPMPLIDRPRTALVRCYYWFYLARLGKNRDPRYLEALSEAVADTRCRPPRMGARLRDGGSAA